MPIKRVAKVSGQPSVGKLSRQWVTIRKPMRAIRSVRTLIKHDPAKGVQSPEFKNTLQRAGVGVRRQGKVEILQKPRIPVAFAKRGGGKVVKPPSPTNKGGVRSPFHK